MVLDQLHLFECQVQESKFQRSLKLVFTGLTSRVLVITMVSLKHLAFALPAEEKGTLWTEKHFFSLVSVTHDNKSQFICLRLNEWPKNKSCVFGWIFPLTGWAIAELGRPPQVSFVWVKCSWPREAEQEFPFHTWVKFQIGWVHPTGPFQWPTLCQVKSIMWKEKHQQIASRIYSMHLHVFILGIRPTLSIRVSYAKWKTRVNHHTPLPSGLITRRTSCKIIKNCSNIIKETFLRFNHSAFDRRFIYSTTLQYYEHIHF